MVNITKSAFVFNGKRYFRAGSESLALVSYGQKKTPVTQANYLAPEGTVFAANLAKVGVQTTGPWPIDWEKYSSTDVDAGISYLKLAGGKGAFSRNAAKAAELVLVKFELAEGALKNLLNNHAGAARTFLDEEGNDARIVSAVFVAMEGKLASDVTTRASGSVSVPVGNSGFMVELGGEGSSNAKSEVLIPPDTTFAYLLHKVTKWDKRDGKRFVEDMQDDQQSLN
ncbi:MAG TPA: hypothetical protein VIM73_16845 [Polyangiaceae bacterium]